MWKETYSEIVSTISGLGVDTPFFRGHGEISWKLLPSLAREHVDNPDEESIFFDFVTRAGDLLPENNSSWANLFAMQHHGLPTRILDWTETFGVALYFALKEGKGDAAVWVLDPFSLNQQTINRPEVLHPHELQGDYNKYYLKKTKKLEGNVVAITPLRHNPRVFHQRSGFTLHDSLVAPLEDLHPEVLRKIIIPAEDREEAKQFLKLAGISDFSLFPDLDGLAREVCAEYFG